MKKRSRSKARLAAEKVMVRLMLKAACDFLEEMEEMLRMPNGKWINFKVHYFRCHGCWKGPDPVYFQPTTADKMVLRKIMERRVREMSDKYLLPKYAVTFGCRALFYDYLPIFDGYNQSHPPE